MKETPFKFLRENIDCNTQDQILTEIAHQLKRVADVMERKEAKRR